MRISGIMVVLLGFQLQLATTGLSQTYDYHLEETPAVSWNGWASQDARMLALAGVSSLASGAFAGSINPALIPSDRRFGVAFTTDRLGFQAYQYWGVNQGVRTDPAARSAQSTFPGGFALSFATTALRASAGWYVSGLLRFPPFEYRQDYEYEQYDSYAGSFSGTENTFFLAAATPTWRRLSVGARVDLIRSTRQITISDQSDYYYPFGQSWQHRRLDIRQEEIHKASILVPGLGLSLQITPGWTANAMVAWPLEGTVDREVTRSFLNPSDDLEIVDPQTGSDPVYQPKRLTLATAMDRELRHSPSARTRLRAGASLDYTRWSRYKYVVFGQEQDRDLVDTFGLAAAIELAMEGQKRSFCLRAGYRFDPQPIREPKTTLHTVSGGGGVRFKDFGLDAGVSYHHGSTENVDQSHLAVGLTLLASFGRTK